MIKNCLAIIFVLLGLTAYPQHSNCEADFQWLQNYVKRNYPGYKDKVNDSTMAKFVATTKRYEDLIKKEHNVNYCAFYMMKWLGFFKDYHLSINLKQDTLGTYVTKSLEFLHFDSLSFMQTVSKNESGIEGIYFSHDSTYTVAIIRNKTDFRDYAGVILDSKTKTWHKGQVKFELKQLSDSTFNILSYDIDHYPDFNNFPVRISRGNFTPPYWHRVVPHSTEVFDMEEMNKYAPQKYLSTYLVNIDSNTSYLRIWSFDPSRSHEIDSVVNNNMTRIKRHKYLIIDIRYNGGGADFSWNSLRPILFTGSAIIEGIDIYSTPDNVRAWETKLKLHSDWGKDYVDNSTAMIKLQTEHPNQMVSILKADTILSDSILVSPKKVVILINGFCASSAEAFLLFAKQSKKVTLMGEHTLGVLDYSNVLSTDFPSMPFELDYPTTISQRVGMHTGIDGVGIQPSIKLLPGTDWIEEAMKWLK